MASSLRAAAGCGAWSSRDCVSLLVALGGIWTAGCSTLWPAVVSTSPEKPVFHAASLAGGSGTDAALCSLSTIGPELTRLVNPPESTEGAIPLEQACAQDALGVAEHRGMAPLVSISTSLGPSFGYLFVAAHAQGVLVAFSGLGMPPDAWINRKFAEVGGGHGLITFAPARDEIARPIYFDPLREARRAIEAAKQIAVTCGATVPENISYVGISLGGLEALLANRESLDQGMATRAAVLDPVLDANMVTSNLDSYWHSFAVDTMQLFFRRILSGRYGEQPVPSFHEVMNRTRLHKDAMTDLDRDVPSAWLCSARRDAYAIFLSDEDPVLGEEQREFAQSCSFPLLPACVPGHVPLACRLDLFEAMIDAIHPSDRAAPAPAVTCPRSREVFQAPEG